MLHLYNNCLLGAMKAIDPQDLMDITYLDETSELLEILNELESNEYIKLGATTGDKYEIKLKVKGIYHSEKLKEKALNSNTVFVAMKYEDDLIEAHKQSMIPACEACGFKVYLISDIEHNQGITDKIIAEIKGSRFVIADLTYNNCGAYFEAGFAQGRGLEVIRTCKKEWFDEKDESGNKKNFLHFDVAHYNCILWENYDELKEKLINRIKATIL